MMMPATSMNDDERTGGRLVAVDGRILPLLGVRLGARARGGVARVTVEQRFRNPFPEPLRVTYQLPLPHDGAVSGFAFRVGDRRIVGELERRETARERFEEAIVSGRSAALVEEARGSLFAQELGNVPAGAEVVAELTVDQKLAWLADGAWEWRFPTTVAPRYLGAPGRVADAARVEVDVADAPLAPRVTVALEIADALAAGGRPESPSHALGCAAEAGALHVALAERDGAPLDRDVVVRWPVATGAVGISAATYRPPEAPGSDGAFALVTLVPPRAAAKPAAFARDLVVLLDTSGSMAGEPLAHAVRVVSALVESLGDEDRLALVAFSSAPRPWRREQPVRATAPNRRAAVEWLAALEAGGATEMKDAVVAALAPLRPDAQRQVVLVTDGLIGFEEELVREVRDRLPRGSRLHTVGVGSAVNRSLTGPAARAGRGVEVVVGLGEDAERTARRLVARTAAPLVTELELDGTAVVARAPERLPDLFAGAPALVALRVRPEGGTVAVRGVGAGGDAWRASVTLPPIAPGSGDPGIAALFGREAVEDLELAAAAAPDVAAVEPAIERLGLELQVATRRTSWVAVSEEPTVDPRAPTRRVRLPHALPHGVSVEGLGLRPAAPAPFVAACAMTPFDAGVMRDGPVFRSRDLPPASSPSGPLVGRLFQRGIGARPPRPVEEPKLRLTGIVTLARGLDLVLEAVLPDDLKWDPPAEVELLLADGSVRTGRLDLDGTTAAGPMVGGQTLRLVLFLPGVPLLATTVTRVTLTSGSDRVVIDVRDAQRAR